MIEQQIRSLIERSWEHRIDDDRYKGFLERKLHIENHQENIIRNIQSALGTLNGQHILDFGAGDGGLVVALRKKGVNIWGIDIEEEFIETAKLRCKRHGIPADIFALYDGNILPYDENYFDAVVSHHVFEHVPHQLGYLQEAKRVLKPGGKLYIGFPNRYAPRETHTGIIGFQFLPKAFRMPVLSRLRPLHYKRFREKNIFMPHFMSPKEGLKRVRQVFPKARFATKELLAAKTKGRAVNPLSIWLYRQIGRQIAILAQKDLASSNKSEQSDISAAQ